MDTQHDARANPTTGTLPYYWHYHNTLLLCTAGTLSGLNSLASRLSRPRGRRQVSHRAWKPLGAPLGAPLAAPGTRPAGLSNPRAPRDSVHSVIGHESLSTYAHYLIEYTRTCVLRARVSVRPQSRNIIYEYIRLRILRNRCADSTCTAMCTHQSQGEIREALRLLLRVRKRAEWTLAPDPRTAYGM